MYKVNIIFPRILTVVGKYIVFICSRKSISVKYNVSCIINSSQQKSYLEHIIFWSQNLLLLFSILNPNYLCISTEFNSIRRTFTMFTCYKIFRRLLKYLMTITINKKKTHTELRLAKGSNTLLYTSMTYMTYTRWCMYKCNAHHLRFEKQMSTMTSHSSRRVPM